MFFHQGMKRCQLPTQSLLGRGRGFTGSLLQGGQGRSLAGRGGAQVPVPAVSAP